MTPIQYSSSQTNKPDGIPAVLNLLITRPFDHALAGREKRSEEIARSALLKGLPPEMVSEITGLDPDTIQRLANR